MEEYKENNNGPNEGEAEELNAQSNSEVEEGEELEFEVIDSDEDMVSNLEGKLEETNNKLLRAYADLDNFRKRTKKEREELVKYGPVSLLESLLPVLDNFERALKASEDNNDIEVLKEGIGMVYKQLDNALKQVGLEVIEAEGTSFDPYKHNAVMNEESSDHEPGTVLQEVQKGYSFKDRVIRPSMVKVSSNT